MSLAQGFFKAKHQKEKKLKVEQKIMHHRLYSQTRSGTLITIYSVFQDSPSPCYASVEGPQASSPSPDSHYLAIAYPNPRPTTSQEGSACLVHASS